jgi:hypothetical protein
MAAPTVNRTAKSHRGPGAGRDALVNYLERQIVGPWGRPDELLDDAPHTRYLLGILFPRQTGDEEMLENEGLEPAGAQGKDDPADDPVAQANTWMPSSFGLSFLIRGTNTIACEVTGAAYERQERKWRRVPLADPGSPERVMISAPAEGREPEAVPVLGGRGLLRSIWRGLRGGHLVTVTLLNAEIRDGGGRPDPARCLFQVGLRCQASGGAIAVYPTLDRLSMDVEDRELAFLHRRAKVFALGHGCAATWPTLDTRAPTPDTIPWVATALLPWLDIPAMSSEVDSDNGILKLATLANKQLDAKALTQGLDRFVAGYAAWIGGLRENTKDVRPEDADVVAGIMWRLENALEAIRRGIRLLATDEEIREAFRLANRAMLLQMAHSQAELGGTRRALGAPPTGSAPDYDAAPFAWRPFQLAFFLQCLPSIADETAPDRDLVELLWFPTGGGKTEAYLGLSAFEILLRRLRHGNRGAGTTVITRYTLRLLTAQQFQRAAAMICAVELLRRERASRMGSEPVTIGLWIGAGQSPNDLAKASELLAEMLEAPEPTNPFVLEQCPWCGTEIVPPAHRPETHFGVRIDNVKCTLFCPSPECVFHAELPVVVVDDDLYRRPPTFLLATVDKFARLAWVEEARAFFGGPERLPPSLVIQDEMHLLSGPLGTTVAAYEASIDFLMASNGARPKVIASTATVRNAASQVGHLFNRPLRVFPPPGLTAADSYFARATTDRPGRRYLGVMAQAHTPDTTLVHLLAALLQGPASVDVTPAELDAYWTLVIYHNSLRELGRTVTRARDDVPMRIESFYARDHRKPRPLGEPEVVELTSHIGGTQLTGLLSRLKLPATHQDAIGVLATTNMISVGVDVPRLGLMLIHGQPKSASEYIQASSRVGRSEVPGLVVVMLNSTKPRDRSHYEGFVPFHQALYRYVEPTSVTPFALPSRDRSLRAALVILMRHAFGLSGNDAAGRFDADAPATKQAVAALLARIEAVDPGELEACREELGRIVSDWQERAALARATGQPLWYDAQGNRQHRSLMVPFGSQDDGWPVLNSMRSVDKQCRVKVVPRMRA